jgi:hypothetical protein
MISARFAWAEHPCAKVIEGFEQHWQSVANRTLDDQSMRCIQSLAPGGLKVLDPYSVHDCTEQQ